MCFCFCFCILFDIFYFILCPLPSAMPCPFDDDNPSQDNRPAPQDTTTPGEDRVGGGQGADRMQSQPRCGLTYPATSEVYQSNPQPDGIIVLHSKK